MTLAVYFSYFESVIGYTNALKSRLGAYEGLELQHSGVWKDFVCIGYGRIIIGWSSIVAILTECLLTSRRKVTACQQLMHEV